MIDWLIRRLREVPVMLGLIAVVGWPLAATLIDAVRSPSDGTGGVPMQAGELARPLGLAAETARLVLATELLAVPLGIGLAVVLFRTDVWGRRGWLAAILLGAFVPMPLVATAWLGALGNAGRSRLWGGGPLLVGWPGAAAIHALASVPWVVAIVGVGLRSVEPDLEDAARLDLGPIGVLVRVTLRRSLGAVAAACLAVAVLTAGDMTVTDLLSVRTFAEEAYTQYQYKTGDDARAALVGVPPLVVLGGLIAWGSRRLRRFEPPRAASSRLRGADWRLGRWRVPLGVGVGGLIALGAGVPVATLVWHAGRFVDRVRPGRPASWSVANVARSTAAAAGELFAPGLSAPLRSPILASLILASAGAAVAVLLGWSLAWLARGSAGWRRVAGIVVAVTLALPAPVAGMALIVAYFPWSGIYDSPLLLILAYALRTLPYALLVVAAAVRGIPPDFVDAASVAGFGPVGTVRRVGLPATRGAIVAAWGVAFALALGELPAANLTTRPGTEPMALKVWRLLHTGVESHLGGVGLVSLAVIAVAGGLAAWGVRRAFGPLFPGDDPAPGKEMGDG